MDLEWRIFSVFIYVGKHGYGHGLAAWSGVSNVHHAVTACRLSALWLPRQTTG